MATWRQLLEEPSDQRHIVQLYRQPSFLQDAVGAWTAGSLRGDGGAVLVGTPSHRALVLERLAEDGFDPAALADEGRLAVVDAEQLMATFFVDRQPDPDRFKDRVGALVAQVREAVPRGGEVRAWGEMVGLLHQRGDLPSAQRLEAFWNEVLAAQDLRLLCSYNVDNLEARTHRGLLGLLTTGHTLLIPEDDYARLDSAVWGALMDVFGEKDARTMWGRFVHQRPAPVGMPAGEAVLVGLHGVAPQLGSRVLELTRFRYHGPAAT